MSNSIVPNCNVENIFLRKKITEYSEMLAQQKSHGLLEFEEPDEYTGCYHLKGLYLEIYVDKRNEKIYKIAVLKGFSGAFEEKIRLGMTIPDACEKDPRLYFKESESIMLFKGIEGICIDLGVDDPWPDELDDLCVDSIIVFATEAFTFEGLKGHW